MIHEVNFDGLPGPTHHYAGLAFGNIASMEHAKWISNPKQAALQSLEKMRCVLRLGAPQGIFLPRPKPSLMFYTLSLTGTEQEKIEKLFKQDLKLFCALFTSASMWAANAATVSASIDCDNNVAHITPANLISNLHRSIEAGETHYELARMFDPKYFHVHGPVPSLPNFKDEGAANHMRFAASHSEKGVNVFVYGKDPKKFPARQSLEASTMIARTHHINTPVLFLQQNPEAIDAGVFHNDVAAINNENVFIYHEKAYTDPHAAALVQQHCNFPLHCHEIKETDLSLKTAIETYFFNSQLITISNNHMALIMPMECQHHPEIERVLSQLITPDSPIRSTHYVRCEQSMHNGGGPACLRLRVPMSSEALAAFDQRYLLNDSKIDQLETWVKQYYRDKLAVEDFLDPAFRLSCKEAMAHCPI